MSFSLPDLPYAKKALEPHLSAETLEFHHDKHHAKYVKTLNELIKGTKWEKMGLEEIIRTAEPGKLFNQAGQHWNHSLYWKCLSPDGGQDPKGELRKAIEGAWGNVDGFRKEFSDVCKSVFGSGWAWLVEIDGRLEIRQTPNAESPLTTPGVTPLLTCDMWEHAYYIDYRNAKDRYLDAFWNVVNWDFVASRFETSESPGEERRSATG